MAPPQLPGADFRHHTLVVLVENKAGVLARVSSLFARRGYNIYSLAVAPTDDERFSRITIVVDVESASLEQITKQLFKLVNVVKISELDPRDAVERELMLATVRADATGRSQVIELVGLFDGRIVDVGHDDPRTVRQEPPGECPADAAGRPGDDRDLSVHAVHMADARRTARRPACPGAVSRRRRRPGGGRSP